MKKPPPDIQCKTAGHSGTDELSVDPGISTCGAIGDGVAFCHDPPGGWVLSYIDLIRIATAAAKARGYRLTMESATKRVTRGSRRTP